MKRTLAFIIAFAGILLPQSCQKSNADTNTKYKPIVLTKAQKEYVDNGNQFAYNWLKVVNKDQKEDWCVSPLSLQFVLSMLANGANEETLSEICSVLGYGEEGLFEVNEYARIILTGLKGIDPSTKFQISSVALADNRLPFVSNFKETVSSFYEASAQEMDFSNKQAVVNWVNDWASNSTNGMIKKILEVSDLTGKVYSIFGNALYFKGKWVSQFKKSDTEQTTFYMENGAHKDVPMMKQKGSFQCITTEAYKQITLWYGNGAFYMDILLPLKDKTIDDAIDYLVNNGRIYGNPRNADIWLPRFEVSTEKMVVNKQLTSLGLSEAVFDTRNYPGMQKDLTGAAIQTVQSTKINVDESGSEAATVTATTHFLVAPPPTSGVFEFHADHPFMYIIRESSTGAILFAGKYGTD